MEKFHLSYNQAINEDIEGFYTMLDIMIETNKIQQEEEKRQALKSKYGNR